MRKDEDLEEHELIKRYFNQGYSNNEIIEFMKLHGVTISLSTLKRRIQSLNLSRRGTEPVTDEEIRKAIEEELGGSGCFIGYRKMWARLKRKGISVSRDRIMEQLRDLDPEGVNSRKKKRLRRRAYHTKGPNYIWHIDGHDKLKPFGFSIHGCIDGFSRRIIWLEVSTTNKNPEVIAMYYLDAVKQIGGAPRKVRSDDGTENSLVEALHTYLIFSTTNNDVDSSCFAIGRSTANQRIEAYWSQLVKDGPGWWINFFKDLRDLHLFNDSDPAHIECIRFCFMHLLRKELYQVAELWNQHIISSSKFGNSSGPRGRPDCMYFLPHLYETENYQVTIAPIELEEFDHATMHPADVCSYNLRTLPRHLKFVFCCFSLLSERKYRFT
jgi:hypothetical protein